MEREPVTRPPDSFARAVPLRSGWVLASGRPSRSSGLLPDGSGRCVDGGGRPRRQLATTAPALGLLVGPDKVWYCNRIVDQPDLPRTERRRSDRGSARIGDASRMNVSLGCPRAWVI